MEAYPFDGVPTVISLVEVRNGNPRPTYDTRPVTRLVPLIGAITNVTSLASIPQKPHMISISYNPRPPLQTSYRKSVKSAAVIAPNHIPVRTPPLPRRVMR